MSARDIWIGNLQVIIHSEPDGYSAGPGETHLLELSAALARYPELAVRVESMVAAAISDAGKTPRFGVTSRVA